MDLKVEDILEGLLVDLLGLSSLLGQLLVPCQEGLDGSNADRDEVSPRDVANLIFIGKSQEHADVILTQVVRGKVLECIVELLIRQITATGNVSLCEKQGQGTLQSLDESR